MKNYRKLSETIIVVLKNKENIYYRYSEDEKGLNIVLDRLENRLGIDDERC